MTLGMRPLAAHCHAALARLRRSDDHLAIATRMYRDMGMTYWLERGAGHTSA
jgi:hypothetical protein